MRTLSPDRCFDSDVTTRASDMSVTGVVIVSFNDIDTATIGPDDIVLV